MGALTAASAQACTSAYAGGSANLVISTWDDTAPDVLISAWAAAGNANFLSGCPSGGPSPVDVIPAMPELVFDHDVVVNGETYPAFSLRGKPRTPLLIFRYLIGNGSGQMVFVPFDARRTLNSSGAGVNGHYRWSVVSVAAVSRGGSMEGIPTTVMGTVTHVYPPNPSLTKVESFSVTANLRTKTCTLNDVPVVLRDTYAGDLPAAGSSNGEQDFDVVMNCNGAFPVSLTLTDANAPGNTGSRLTPTANATAAGVRVQLLREGVPVVLGQSWTLPMSQSGRQDLPLAARYYRETGSFSPGVVEGQAIITATYR